MNTQDPSNIMETGGSSSTKSRGIAGGLLTTLLIAGMIVLALTIAIIVDRGKTRAKSKTQSSDAISTFTEAIQKAQATAPSPRMRLSPMQTSLAESEPFRPQTVKGAPISMDTARVQMALKAQESQIEEKKKEVDGLLSIVEAMNSTYRGKVQSAASFRNMGNPEKAREVENELPNLDKGIREATKRYNEVAIEYNTMVVEYESSRQKAYAALGGLIAEEPTKQR